MKKTQLTTRLFPLLILLLFLSSCGGGGGGIQQLQPDVEGPFNEYFEVTDNGDIERDQDGDWVQYEFKVLVKVKKQFPCRSFDEQDSSPVSYDKHRVYVKFYDKDKKPLPMDSDAKLRFSEYANLSVGKALCAVLDQPAGTETWYSFRTANHKKGESDNFDAYPSGEIKYFSITSGE